jgi:hypothetical protein
MGILFAFGAGYLIHKHLTDSWVGTAALLGPAYIALYLLVAAAYVGGVARQRFLIGLHRQILRHVPDMTILSGSHWEAPDGWFSELSSGYEVAINDGEAGQKPLYRGSWHLLWPGLGWTGDDRFASEVKQALRRHRAAALVLGLLVGLPALLVTIGAGLTDSWVWFGFSLLLLLPQFGVFLLPFPSWLHDVLD